MDNLQVAMLSVAQHLEPFVGVLVPVAILVLGWLVAFVVSALVRRVLKKTELDDRLMQLLVGEEAAAKIEVEKWVSNGVYYLVMLFVLVTFFQHVGLAVVTEPLNQVLMRIFAFVPNLISAGLLLGVAWALASLLRVGVSRILAVAKVEERLGEQAAIQSPGQLSIPQSVGNAVYWLIFLVFLPAILDALGLDGLLQPVRGMLEEIMGFVPNLFGSGLILLVGWFGARIVQRVISNLLAATGIDRAGEQSGLKATLGEQMLSGLVGKVVYTFILVLATIAALEALEFDAISAPASEMLTQVLGALPLVFTAVFMLLVAYLVGRFVSDLVTDLLARMGFNTILARLGIGQEPTDGDRTPAEVVGYLTQVGVVLFAAIEATSVVGFDGVSGMLVDVMELAGRVVIGLILVGFGLYLANLIAEVVDQRRGTQSGLLSMGVRVSILVLTAAMALQHIGFGAEIINLAFGLILGAVAVALALAFGLGARDLAARELENWVEGVKKQDEKKG